MSAKRFFFFGPLIYTGPEVNQMIESTAERVGHDTRAAIEKETKKNNARIRSEKYLALQETANRYLKMAEESKSLLEAHKIALQKAKEDRETTATTLRNQIKKCEEVNNNQYLELKTLTADINTKDKIIIERDKVIIEQRDKISRFEERLRGLRELELKWQKAEELGLISLTASKPKSKPKSKRKRAR